MGLTNIIKVKKPMNCPYCGKRLGYPDEVIQRAKANGHNIGKGFDLESKDMHDRCNAWNVGEKITILGGGLTFTAIGNIVWEGITSCFHCKKYIEADIIIKDGIITEIKFKEEEKNEEETKDSKDT